MSNPDPVADSVFKVPREEDMVCLL